MLKLGTRLSVKGHAIFRKDAPVSVMPMDTPPPLARPLPRKDALVAGAEAVLSSHMAKVGWAVRVLRLVEGAAPA